MQEIYEWFMVREPLGFFLYFAACYAGNQLFKDLARQWKRQRERDKGESVRSAEFFHEHFTKRYDKRYDALGRPVPPKPPGQAGATAVVGRAKESVQAGEPVTLKLNGSTEFESFEAAPIRTAELSVRMCPEPTHCNDCGGPNRAGGDCPWCGS